MTYDELGAPAARGPCRRLGWRGRHHNSSAVMSRWEPAPGEAAVRAGGDGVCGQELGVQERGSQERALPWDCGVPVAP